MNKLLLSALFMTLVTVAKAQIPQQLNYQGIARTNSGAPITYQNINVRISLVDSAGGGFTAYRETRTVRTNYVGLFNIIIGSPGAASTVGRMQDVNWITGRKYIKLEIDPTGSSNFTLAGVTQLQSVPYALSAGSALVSGDANGDLTGTYPGPTIANGVITTSKLANGSVDLSKLEPTLALTLANKLNAADTANMLLPYALKTDVDTQLAAGAPTFTTGTAGQDFNITSVNNEFTLNIPDASDTARGLVTFNDQVFYGTKFFNSGVVADGIPFNTGLGKNVHNIAIGGDALGTGTGTRNTAVGYGAMRSYSGESFDVNSSFGYFNMAGLTTGEANTSVGTEAMMALTTGRRNTAMGQQSLIQNTGDENTALGSGAGHNLVLGYRNTFLGTSSNASLPDLENATALGYLAIVEASNTIQLGNTDITSVNTSGKLTTGAVTYPNADGTAGQVLTTNGSGSAYWSPASVREAADEFDADAGQLEFILTETPATNSKIKMYINGIRISNKAYVVNLDVLTYDPSKNGSYTLTAADRIQFDYSY